MTFPLEEKSADDSFSSYEDILDEHSGDGWGHDLLDPAPMLFAAPVDRPAILSASDLTRWLPETTTSSAKSLLRPQLIAHLAPGSINLTAKVATSDDKIEAVSEINGLAIPAMLEARCAPREVSEPSSTPSDGSSSSFSTKERRTKKKTFCSTMYLQLLEASREAESDRMHPAILEKFLALAPPCPTHPPSYFLELSALYLAGAAATSKGFISKVLQIRSYDWLTCEEASVCIDVLSRAVTDSSDAKFEYGLTEQFRWQDGRAVEVQGAVDIISPTVLWEVKCVSQLSDSHFLQLAVYAWLWNRTRKVVLEK